MNKSQKRTIHLLCAERETYGRTDGDGGLVVPVFIWSLWPYFIVDIDRHKLFHFCELHIDIRAVDWLVSLSRCRCVYCCHESRNSCSVTLRRLSVSTEREEIINNPLAVFMRLTHLCCWQKSIAKTFLSAHSLWPLIDWRRETNELMKSNVCV